VEAVLAPDPSEVMGVNDKVQLAEVEGCYRKLCARTLMLAGATLADPARIDIRGDIQVGRDVYIDVNAVLVGKVHLGSRVRIGPNCLIQNARIGADTEVLANTVIENAVIGEHCRLGPFARIRPETLLHRGVHVGNFVEIKKSEFGPGSKANHLSYVGDSRVGSDVNVGAGTITCNYDGKTKSLTKIGANVFVGSDSTLVAPLEVADGSYIAAGSTITEDVPADALALGRARQTIKPEWAKKMRSRK
jgi:bifunctional UDP-N-acetylglucosamine pyrophosphorylase/glucosamine-1-phosphate N-acetyltransferase